MVKTISKDLIKVLYRTYELVFIGLGKRFRSRNKFAKYTSEIVHVVHYVHVFVFCKGLSFTNQEKTVYSSLSLGFLCTCYLAKAYPWVYLIAKFII